MIPERTIYTFTGRQFSLDSKDNDISLIDIAHALSMQCRFTGHIKENYSVAQHCLWVSMMVGLDGGTRQEMAQALFHDASEAYLADLARPFKREVSGYAQLEFRIHCEICERFGLPVEIPPIVKKWDHIACIVEARDFHVDGVYKQFRGYETVAKAVHDCPPLVALDALSARRLFFRHHHRLVEAGAVWD